MNQSIELQLNQIRTDGGTQPRAQLNYNTVTEYAESIEDGATFPPVEVMYDGSDYWLWDGFHRVESHKKAGCTAIRANVKQGTRRDAVLASVGANNDHGLRRTNDDKRRAVMTLLNDAEWVKWSDREIARQCGVTHPFVSGIRQNLSGNNYQMPQDRVVNRNGTTYAQNTTNIGKAVTPPVGGIKLQPRPAGEVVRSETRFAVAPPMGDDELDEMVNNAKEDDDGYDWTAEEPELVKNETPIFELQSKPPVKKPEHFTLTATQWNDADAAQRKDWLLKQHQSSATFNQTNDNIEWAGWS